MTVWLQRQPMRRLTSLPHVRTATGVFGLWMPAGCRRRPRKRVASDVGVPPQPQVFCFVMGSGWCRTRISERALMGVSSTWKGSFTDVPRRRRKTASEHKLAFDQWRLLFGTSNFQLLGRLGRAFKLCSFQVTS